MGRPNGNYRTLNIKITQEQYEFLEKAANEMTRKIKADMVVSKSAVVRFAINIYRDNYDNE